MNNLLERFTVVILALVVAAIFMLVIYNIANPVTHDIQYISYKDHDGRTVRHKVCLSDTSMIDYNGRHMPVPPYLRKEVLKGISNYYQKIDSLSKGEYRTE